MNIADDTISEYTENFFGTLTASGQPAILNPDSACVNITDNDCKLFYVNFRVKLRCFHIKW